MLERRAQPLDAYQLIALLWGVGGFVLVLVFAIVRLMPFVVDALAQPLHWLHWLFLVGVCLFMAYFEGYRGMQQRYTPRLLRHADVLADRRCAICLIVAPLYCMGYLARDSWWRSLLVTAMIVGMVFLVHQMAQPWRGLLDAGVVIGLSWGAVASVLAALDRVVQGDMRDR